MTSFASLDDLFDHWERDYPPEYRSSFCRDGIVDIERFSSERLRVLFLAKEANVQGGKLEGADLRVYFRESAGRGAFGKNIARWTRLLMDDSDWVPELTAKDIRRSLSRVAVMNLKKVGGGGSGNVPAIAISAWQDRELICEEIKIVNPDVVIVGGSATHQILRCVLEDDPFLFSSPPETYRHDSYWVVEANHPSVRAHQAPDAFARLAGRLESVKGNLSP